MQPAQQQSTLDIYAPQTQTAPAQAQTNTQQNSAELFGAAATAQGTQIQPAEIQPSGQEQGQQSQVLQSAQTQPQQSQGNSGQGSWLDIFTGGGTN